MSEDQNQSAANYAAKISYFPKKEGQPFGYVTVQPEGGLGVGPVLPVCVFHGIGERGNGSVKDLEKLASWPGWHDPNGPSLFASVNRWNVVFILVQTDGDFNKGEIAFAAEIAESTYRYGVAPAAIGLSLGGFALITMYATSREPVVFSSVVLVMPGGNELLGQSAGVKLREMEIPVLAFHAQDDKVASWKVSDAVIRGYNSLMGGTERFSELALYEKGGHNISSRPFGSWFPWSSWNTSDKKIVDGFYKPDRAMVQWIVGEVPPVAVPVPVEPGELLIDCRLRIFKLEDGYNIEVTGVNDGLKRAIESFVESMV